MRRSGWSGSTRRARPAGRVFSPLDAELELLPGRLSPRLHAGLVRLGAWMPFAQAAAGLAWFTGAPVGRETARRLTEAAGAALVALEDAEAERLATERPPPPEGPRVVQLSLDGAMVPLVGGDVGDHGIDPLTGANDRGIDPGSRSRN